MIYAICFFVSFMTLFYLLAHGKGVDINVIIGGMVVIIGNAGYYALYDAHELAEAILANKITYVIGCFSPMIIFIVICNICKVKISNVIQIFMYLVQVVIYLSVCLTGKSTAFYKTITFARDSFGGYLQKTYGPMHTFYLITLFAYMVLSALVVGTSIAKKTCRVSSKKANAILILFMISAVLYFVERLAGMKVEVTPIIFTTTWLFVAVMMVNISRFSAYGNLEILEEKNTEIAYLVFDKKLHFMSFNDYAGELFPELNDWKLEGLIPGNGGRFNTFLRIPFMEYVNAKREDKFLCGFELQDRFYRVEISTLKSGDKRGIGYVIEVAAGGMML